MHVIGEENSQRLDKIPARYQVLLRIVPNMAAGLRRRNCPGAGSGASDQERIPTEAVVASVVVDKFAWHNPLYRQAQIMKLQGLPVDRSTLAFWVGRRSGGAQARLSAHEGDPARLGQDAVDETRAPVLDPGRGRTKDGLLSGRSRETTGRGRVRSAGRCLHLCARPRWRARGCFADGAIPASCNATAMRSTNNWRIQGVMEAR